MISMKVVNAMIGARSILFWIIICFSSIALTAADEQSEGPVVVNIMIGAELHPGSSEMDPEAKWDLEVGSIIEMLNKIDPLALNVTVSVTGDYVNEIAGNAMYKLYVTSVGSRYNHELAVYGMTAGEELGPMAYGDQYSRLMEAKRLVESAYICDGRTILVKGLVPHVLQHQRDDAPDPRADRRRVRRWISGGAHLSAGARERILALPDRGV